MRGPFPPKVSIGLPVDNDEKYLRETLLSLVAQDYPNLEIIISDNASTDGTAGIIEAFLSQGSSIRVITQAKRLTMRHHFSSVLEKASGEYFCWAAAEDLRSPRSIFAMAAVLDRHPEVVGVMTDVVNLDEETQSRRTDRLEGIRLEAVLKDWPSVRRLFFEVPASNVFFCFYGLYRTRVVRAAHLDLKAGWHSHPGVPFLAQVALRGPVASLKIEGLICRRHAQSIEFFAGAGEGPEIVWQQNNVIRGVLREMVLASFLPLSEKLLLHLELRKSWQRDRLVEALSAENVARARTKGKLAKKKKKARRNFFKWVRSRIQRAIFGKRASPWGREREAKKKVEKPAAGRGARPDEEVVVASISSIAPAAIAQSRLIQRGAAGMKRQDKEWRVGRDRSIGFLFRRRIASVIDCEQCIEALRELGRSGQIHSSESFTGASEVLEENADGVDAWQAFPVAPGETQDDAEIKGAGSSAFRLNPFRLRPKSDKKVEGMKKLIPRSQLRYLLLGRLGDITTLLPALKHEAERTGRPARLIVAEAYANLLDGVSYVEGIIWSHGFERSCEAAIWAKRRLPEPLIDCSVYGANVLPDLTMTSFDREIWRLSGCSLRFETAPLVFDQRDDEREGKLLGSLRKTDRPMILTALKGTSSPFPEARQLFERLVTAFPYSEVVDISEVEAGKPYDLLGLYEVAETLVAVDSFPLHLAQATPHLNVVALIPDGPTPWHRSAWRPNHLARVLYSDTFSKFDQIVQAIDGLSQPTLLLATYGDEGSTLRESERTARALEGRQREKVNGVWSDVFFEPRRDATSTHDEALPFVRDLIEAAVATSSDENDIVVLCHHEIGFVSGLTGRIIEAVQRTGAAYAHRWDFDEPLTVRLPANEKEVATGRCDAGSDLFAFSVRWWKACGSLSFPEAVLEREAWDLVMRRLIKKHGGEELHAAIWHERHSSLRGSTANLSGNSHNRGLAKRWLTQTGGGWEDWKGPQH